MPKRRDETRGRLAENAEALGIGELLHRLQDAVVVSDSEGRILVWNTAATRILGWEADEALGRDVAFIIPERYRARHEAGMQRFREGGRGPLLESHDVLELPALHKEGREVIVDLTLTTLPRRDAELAPPVLAILRDVTERVRLLRRVEEANRHLRVANESLEAFSYMVSHDLKEPVRGVEVYHRALSEDYGDRMPEGARDLLRGMGAAATRLNALLRSLLEISRTARIAPEALQAVDVRDAVDSEGCRTRYETVVAERAATLEVAVVHGTPPVLGTDDALCQLLGNLIVNAVKHNPRVGPWVRVRAAPVDDDQTLVDVTVEDDGPGIPVDQQARLATDLGSSGSTAPSAGQRGFGLTIIRRTAERLNGRVWVGTSEKGGSAVHVVLPAADGGARPPST